MLSRSDATRGTFEVVCKVENRPDGTACSGDVVGTPATCESAGKCAAGRLHGSQLPKHTTSRPTSPVPAAGAIAAAAAVPAAAAVSAAAGDAIAAAAVSAAAERRYVQSEVPRSRCRVHDRRRLRNW